MNFRSPVGEDNGTFWPGAWFDATGYAVEYMNGWYHTGADLNCNEPEWDADAGAPVYSVAAGVVTWAGERDGTWGNVIVIRHRLNETTMFWSRYAHVSDMLVKKGDLIPRGHQIASIGDAGGQLAYHLHFDIAVTDMLEYAPGHWPGADKQAVLDNYADPLQFLRDNTTPEEVVMNLIKNGSFEGGTYVDDAVGDRRVPDSWQFFQYGNTGKVHVEIEQHPPHVADGVQSARVFTQWENHRAGLFQQVNVEEGAKYRLKAKVFVWVSQSGQVDTPSNGGASAFLGIDTTGGIDPTSPSVTWVSKYEMDKFISLGIDFTARASKVTVFLKSETEWPFTRNDFFWDAISMEKYAEAPEEEPGVGSGDNTAVALLLDEAMELLLEAKSLLNEEDGGDTPVTPPVEDYWTHEVSASDGLYLRASAGGTKLRLMPMGEKVAAQSGSKKIGKYTWVPVVTAYDIGWCAKEYLRPLVVT